MEWDSTKCRVSGEIYSPIFHKYNKRVSVRRRRQLKLYTYVIKNILPNLAVREEMYDRLLIRIAQSKDTWTIPTPLLKVIPGKNFVP